MPTLRNREAARLVRQSTELALAAPQVIAHRVTRMAAAGGRPSARDQQEFTRMVLEKQVAFSQAWSAMAVQAAMSGPALALAMARAWGSPLTLGSAGGQSMLHQWQGAMLSMMNTGLAPVRAKAVANARRLSRG